MPLYLLGLKHESETLTVPMAESAIFQRGYKNIPSRLLLEVQASSEVQVYDVRVQFTARFAGLRWLMYNHRIIAFIIFTTAFWIAEMVFAVLGWLGLRRYLMPEEGVKKEEEDETIKEEDGDEMDLSDVPRTFPRSGPPLRGAPTIKDEGSEEFDLDETDTQAVTAGLDGEDIEEEKASLVGSTGGRADSGIGTSFSEGSAHAGLSRRKSRGRQGGG
jgi:hypothetical protein